MDIVLNGGVDEVGDVPAQVDVLADAGGADVLQVGGQLQVDDLAGDVGDVHVFHHLVMGGGAAEDDVVEMVDRAGLGFGLVGGGACHHVGAHSEVDLPAAEDLAQAAQVIRVCQVHRDIVGEEVDVKLVGHGHADDLAAHQGRLGLLGPGEFIHRQIHLVSKVADLLHDALVRQGEGVEGAGEEGHLFMLGEGEGAAFDAVADDEAVNMAQGRGGIEEGQLLLALLMDEEEDLLGHEGEERFLILIGQGLGGEKVLAQDAQGFLADGLVAGGQALEEKTCQLLPAGGEHILLFGKAGGVFGIVLQHGAHGRQGRVYNAGIGGGEEGEQLLDDLIQLPGCKPEDELAQIFRDILAQLRLAGLQSLGHLHGDLIAAGGGQHLGHSQKGLAGKAADHHGLAHLHEV